MNVKDILIDMPLFREQYEFLLSICEKEAYTCLESGFLMDQYDEDMWDGILNFFETVLDEHRTDMIG